MTPADTLRAARALIERPKCECRFCIDRDWPRGDGELLPPSLRRLVLCAKCRNKRCPHAKFHGYVCTGSNAPFQVAIEEESMLTPSNFLRVDSGNADISDMIEWLGGIASCTDLDPHNIAHAIAERLRAGQAREAELRYTIEQQKRAMQWRPIEEAPPNTRQLLGWLYVDPWDNSRWEEDIGVAQDTRGGWRHGHATHWMPLPQPPEGE